MRASGLGKVSRDKWRRAMTSDNTIAADHDKRNWRRSHREAPKRSRHKPLKREEEGRGDQLWSHKWPCQRAQQECCEGVVSITTKLILGQRLSSQVRQSPQNKRGEHSHEARWPSQRETPGRLGKFMPLISYDASVGINKKTKTRTTMTKITSKNHAINVRHHDNRRHSSEDESRDDPRKFCRQRRQRERKQEQQLLVRR
jgi:hypothetical protein